MTNNKETAEALAELFEYFDEAENTHLKEIIESQLLREEVQKEYIEELHLYLTQRDEQNLINCRNFVRRKMMSR